MRIAGDVLNTPVLDLSFEVITKGYEMTREYTRECSGARSDCCTRVCTRIQEADSSDASFDAWEKYLDINAGVLQY